MRNAVVPLVSSQLYNFGINEAHQVPSFNDVPFSTDNKISGHDGGSYYWDSKFFNDGNQIRSGGFSLPNYQYQPVSSYQEPTAYSASPCSGSISQQSMALTKNFSFPQVEMDIQTEQMKRSSTEISSMFPAQRGIISTDRSGNKTVMSEWKKNKRTKVSNINDAEQFHQAMDHTTQQQQNLQVPVRRSQKLSDKITSLQKLVSPYGKTDTASVLQEASLYIKLLHDQIQNLYEMLSSSYNRNVTPLQLPPRDSDDSKLLNLRNRGLCLVPISFSQKMAQEEDRISCSPNNGYYSRSSTSNFLGRNF